MFPFFEVLGLKMYMTGIGIVIFLLTFIVVSKYLCNKWHQDFYKLFYWLPIFIVITYFMGAYVQFFLDVGFMPQNIEELRILISPYGYDFHFVGLIIGFLISLFLFFNNIQRVETKKIWIDIIFFSFSLSLIPLGLFLMFGDDFIGKSSNGFLTLKPLTTESELNKFNGVYPIGLFLSFASAISVLFTYFLKKKGKQFGYGVLGFISLIFGFNIVFMFQQYPRYGIMSFEGMMFDIKHYISFFVIMFCLYVYYKRVNKIKKSV